MTVRPRTGVLVIRVWMEEGALRARMTTVDDVERPDGEVVATAAGADDILATVRDWVARWSEQA